jgi:hypothetical protein
VFTLLLQRFRFNPEFETIQEPWQNSPQAWYQNVRKELTLILFSSCGTLSAKEVYDSTSCLPIKRITNQISPASLREEFIFQI